MHYSNLLCYIHHKYMHWTHSLSLEHCFTSVVTCVATCTLSITLGGKYCTTVFINMNMLIMGGKFFHVECLIIYKCMIIFISCVGSISCLLDPTLSHFLQLILLWSTSSQIVSLNYTLHSLRPQEDYPSLRNYAVYDINLQGLCTV